MLPTNKSHYSGIDTWRGLAALMVCVFHFSLHQNNFGSLFPEGHFIHKAGSYGYLGVYVFFVISGFVVPLSMWKGEYVYKKFGKFLAKRSLRIEPPYIATILVIIVISFYFVYLWGGEITFDIKRFFANAFYVVPFVKGVEWYNIIFWTLAIEFQFYITCAILFPLWTHRNRIVRHLSFLAFLASAWFVADNRFVTFYAAIFGFGIALFLFRKAYINIFEFLAYVILASFLLYKGNTPEIFICTAITFLLLLLPDFHFKPGTWLGKISYSLYLIHGSTGSIYLLFFFKGNQAFSIVHFAVAILVSVVGAALFYFIVERPFQNFSRKIKL